MFDALSREERLRLMKFVCSFAWADLEIRDEERAFVHHLIRRLDLDRQDSAQVAGWLTVPPRAEDVDPLEIPVDHRQLFLDTVLQMAGADGELSHEEAENYNLLSQLVQ